jgi:hypothetical protein
MKVASHVRMNMMCVMCVPVCGADEVYDMNEAAGEEASMSVCMLVLF